MLPYTRFEELPDVMKIMADRGLIDTDDTRDPIDQARDVFKRNGLVASSSYSRDSDTMKLGQCVLLPSEGETVYLLLVTPLPADEYTADLRRKPSPILFERTDSDQIIIPGRMLLAMLEDLAENPEASEELATRALNLSRRSAPIPDQVLPLETGTVALEVKQLDGGSRTFEAILGGRIFEFRLPSDELT